MWQLVAAFAAPIVAALVIWILNRILEKRPRLIALIGHYSTFTLRSPPPSTASPNVVYGNSIVLKNSGKKVATNVRVAHNNLPDYRIHPPIKYREDRQDDGAVEIVFPKLVPGEQVTISYLFYDSTPWETIYLHTKSDEGFAQALEAIPTPRPTNFVVWSIRAFAFVGISAVVYLLVSLVASRLLPVG